MNNKGQVLVVFIILLPIFLLILGFVIDYGMLSIEKKNVDENTYDAVKYYIENIDDIDIEDKVKKILNSNLDNIDINISTNENFVEIIVNKEYEGIYKSLYDGNIEVKYMGMKDTKEVIKG